VFTGSLGIDTVALLPTAAIYFVNLASAEDQKQDIAFFGRTYTARSC